jgi:hypothetical protein
VIYNENLFISGATAGKSAFLKALVDCPYLSVGVGSNTSRLFKFGNYKNSNDFFLIDSFKYQYYAPTLKTFLKGQQMSINIPYSSYEKKKKTPVIIISKARWDRTQYKKQRMSDGIITSLEGYLRFVSWRHGTIPDEFQKEFSWQELVNTIAFMWHNNNAVPSTNAQGHAWIQSVW